MLRWNDIDYSDLEALEKKLLEIEKKHEVGDESVIYSREPQVVYDNNDGGFAKFIDDFDFDIDFIREKYGMSQAEMIFEMFVWIENVIDENLFEKFLKVILEK